MSQTQKKMVTHIITGLNVGGAESMLFKLLKNVDRQRFPSRVISLTDIGVIGEQIKAVGIPVFTIGMKPGSFSFSGIQKLVDEFSKHKPIIVQTWMYHADLLGGWAARKAGVDFIAWNIRNSTLDWKKSKFTTRATVSLCSILSNSIPDRIVVCSSAAAEVHRKAGYNASKFHLLPNGFDLSVFKPDPGSREMTRAYLKLSLDSSVIGLAARFDPQKDHHTFIKAAGLVLSLKPETQFLLCGDGITSDNPQLNRWITETGHPENFHLLGRWKEMQSFHNACDIEVSSSIYGESFSNVLGEAMACGIPCVSTRVGGAEEVLGETGRLVPAGRAELMAEALLDILNKSPDERRKLGRLARQRIIENFSIEEIAKRYMDLWEDMSKCN